MRHGYFFVLASAPESPNRTSFHRRQQAMPSRSMLAHPHHGPDHAPPSLILRELEGFDGGTASIATPPQAAADGLLLRVDVDSVRAQLRVTGSGPWVGTCPPSGAGDFFAVLLRPSGDFAGLAGLKTFVMLASFRAFLPL